MHDILQNLGIPNNEDTLSTVGGPCHFDYKKLNYELPDACAICVTGTHWKYELDILWEATELIYRYKINILQTVRPTNFFVKSSRSSKFFGNAGI